MFTLDLQVAKNEFVGDSQDIIMFLVLVDSGRKLPVYIATSSSLAEICLNILDYRESLVGFLVSCGFEYGALLGISYVQ